MVTKKTTKSRSAPRRAAPAAKKKGRRVSTLNRSVKKPARAIGVAVGAMIPYAGSIVDSVKSKSIAPMSSAIMSKDNAVKAAKGAAVGFIAGTVAGMVVDKAGLKKPVNKILKSVKGLTGGIL
jgi:hypothetical protein